MKSISIFLITVALVVGMAGCGGNGTPTQYTLSVSCTVGGNVTNPGTGTFIYPAGAVVLLEVEAEEDYGFTHWSGDVATIADTSSATTSITMNGHYLITANFAYGNFIQTWYDLDDIRDDLSGYYILMNGLDSTTPGYTEVASDVANQGKGWQPIGTGGEPFIGSFDGKGYEIRDLCISRAEENEIGLFGFIGEDGGVIKSVGVVDVDVIGEWGVAGLVGVNIGGAVISNCYVTGSVGGGMQVGHDIGGLVGINERGTISNCYVTGSVTGGGEIGEEIGGLIGVNFEGSVSDCYATGSVTGGGEFGGGYIGGLIGANMGGIVSNCYATSGVSGGWSDGWGIGGLVGVHGEGMVSNSYSTGSVTGDSDVGGLVGTNDGTVSNSYSTGSVTGDYSVGGLVGDNRYGVVSNSHYNYDEVLINGENVITVGALFDADFDEWLTNDKFLDINERLSKVSGYYLINDIGDFKELLAFGQDDLLEFRLNGDLDLASQSDFYVPYLAGEFDGDGYTISNLNFGFGFVSNVGLFGYLGPGGEVHGLGVENADIVGSSYVGGLVGYKNDASVSDCYSTGSVTGDSSVGGLVGYSRSGTMSNSYSTAAVMGDGSVVGGLLGGSQYGTSINDCYSTGSVTGGSFAGGLAGAYSGGTVSNCYATGGVTGSGSCIGGLLGSYYDGTVSECHATGSVAGSSNVGGLIGNGDGTVSHCYATGNVTGDDNVGGLAGSNYYYSNVDNSYATGSVTGSDAVGGLVGRNEYGSVSNSYSMGSVDGDYDVGGLVGYDYDGTVTNSFWDTETSGQAASAGGTGKTTAEMQDISTFSGAAWDIVAVANPDIRNTSYIWNIVDDETYPFLNWEPV